MINSIARELACPERWPLLDGCANLMREAAQGHARYEVLRVMNPKEFAELWARSLLGERFDDMVDEIVKDKNEPYRGHPQYGDGLVRKRMDSCK